MLCLINKFNDILRQWAEKHGCAGDSILWDEGMTPDTIPWSIGNITNYYDSPIIYYAVGN